MGNQQGGNAPNDYRQAPRTGECIVYSLTNTGMTGGIKDIKSDSYTASKIQTINTSQWEDYGNAQGATSVICRLVSFGDYVYRPANPTRVTSVTVRNQGTSPITINPGSSATLPAVSSNLYDCTTWAYYYSAPSYDYVGYFASAYSKTTETKTVLAQSGSTATQNFAFDMGEDEI